MSLSQLLGFGKKRRTVKKKSVDARPSAAVRRMCKKLGVRLTRKMGSKRVYKSEAMLKKQCKAKMMALKKKGPKKTVRRSTRRSRFGGMSSLAQNMGYEFCDAKKYRGGVLSDDSTGLFPSPCRLRESAVAIAPGPGPASAFGKKKRVARKTRDMGRKSYFGAGDMGVGPMAFGSYDLGVGAFSSFGRAVRAYRNYYGATRGRKSGFGYTPGLQSMMGYEFCDPKKYRGGVLSEDSTGLFPSPCRLRESAVAAPIQPAPGPGPAAFGKKRRSVKKSSSKTARPSAAVRRMCKKHGVKLTRKVGSKRVYKSEKVLRAQCAKKMKAAKRSGRR